MKDHLSDYTEYRLAKAKEAIADVKLLAQNNRWTACMNRMYYACFYAASALMAKEGIAVKTHSGLKTKFNLHFVKTGLISKEQGKLYAQLMDWRDKGDYGDTLNIDADNVMPMLKPVEEFVVTIIALIGNYS